MPVTVIHVDGQTTFDNADSWSVDDELGLLDVEKSGSNGELTRTLGTFANGHWKSVRKDPKQDVQLQLEEALELLRAVDDGNFGHQDEDWKDRADSLLANHK